ncbi:MAG: hypothetical protein ACTSU5_20710 [Promethearchaeota archaeon]
MLRTSVHFITGLEAWKFAMGLVVGHDQVKVGRSAASMVARLVLRDPGARVRHSHGTTGSDVEGKLRLESKFKAHLLTNANDIVGRNVAKYKARQAEEDGIAIVTAVIVGGPAAPTRPSTPTPKDINIPGELVVLVVLVLHDSGGKHSISAADIVKAAKEAMANQYPDEDFQELDRDEFLALVQFRGLQAFSEHLDNLEEKIDSTDAGVATLGGEIDSLDGKVDSLEGKVDSLDGKVDSLDGKVDSLEGKVDSLDGKVDSLEGKVDSLATLLEKILDRL